jgi:hypothetical protein
LDFGGRDTLVPWIAFFGSLLLLFLEVARPLLCNEIIMTRPSPGLLPLARGTVLVKRASESGEWKHVCDIIRVHPQSNSTHRPRNAQQSAEPGADVGARAVERRAKRGHIAAQIRARAASSRECTQQHADNE